MIAYLIRRLPTRRPRRHRNPYAWTPAQIVCGLAYVAFLGGFVLIATIAGHP